MPMCVCVWYRDIVSETSLQQGPGGAKWSQQGSAVDYTPIECLINDDYTVPCRREASEVYLPFSFLAKYFEVRTSTLT